MSESENKDLPGEIPGSLISLVKNAHSDITLGERLKERALIFCEVKDISLSELVNRLLERHLEEEAFRTIKLAKNARRR